MLEIEVITAGVKKLLENLQPNKGRGPAQLPPRVTLLKEIADVIADPLKEIFQASLNTSTVLSQCRLPNVTTVLKKGYRNSANYQLYPLPVSLTSICCKLNEHIHVIAKAIVNHFELHIIPTDSQHGFHRGRSHETQLLSFSDKLARGLSAGQQIDINNGLLQGLRYNPT